MDHPSITVTVDDHVATVLLDRPPVNATNIELLEGIRDVFGAVGSDRDVRAVVFGSAVERAFCAGADLRADRGGAASSPKPLDPGRLSREAFWAVLECEVPVVAAVNGPALGSGLALVACCDVIVASQQATFGCPEIDVGLLGAGSHLQRMVGPYRMRELYLTGRRVPAAEFAEMGAVSRVVDHDRLMPEAQDLARMIASKSPVATRLAKEALNRVEYLPLKEAYRVEQDYTARLRRFDDSKEAALAFAERRDPVFTGT